ncbi:MAG: DUF192 domain-containing protein [Victivallales bacterium]|nr:DUF192 domain-containing protein [Victivallales bacterium]
MRSIPQFLLFVVLGLFLTVSGAFCAEAVPKHWPLLIKDAPFAKIELALTPSEHKQGLMKRKTLAEDGGMLFVFPEASVLKFWMMDTWIPLDVVYLDERGVVVAIHTMPPEPRKANEDDESYCRRLKTYSSVKPAIAALELNAGTAESLGLQVGDTIDLRLADLAQKK